MASRSLLRSAAMRSRIARSTGFGSPRDHDPKWVENWTANTRKGQDSMDWFFRAFNATGIYETFLKSSPRYYGFMVMGGVFISYYWSRAWDHYWCYENKGKIYKDCPYVYPVEEED
mmetsp:Transcript_20789/g.37869  ORF Transcript_20789/g.37869 Transcript_20789/m.37869 type:complete len:116 (+) Transcript_20789:89-436(+)